jgi:hypothetical protein
MGISRLFFYHRDTETQRNTEKSAFEAKMAPPYRKESSSSAKHFAFTSLAKTAIGQFQPNPKRRRMPAFHKR